MTDPRALHYRDVQEMLRRLESLTRYPSIPTFHAMDSRGTLTDEVQVTFDADEPVYVTEKLDGTNVRVIFCPRVAIPAGPPPHLVRNDRMLYATQYIGSRKELLWARGDLVGSSAMGIVSNMRGTPFYWEIERWFAEKLNRGRDRIITVYGELYGTKEMKCKAYAKPGFRVFDVSSIPVEYLEREPARIAAWRDAGKQEFLDSLPIPPAMCPALGCMPAGEFGIDHAHCLRVLEELLPKSCLGPGKAEGIVVRNADRSRIAKLRFEDYRRALRAKRG